MSKASLTTSRQFSLAPFLDASPCILDISRKRGRFAARYTEPRSIAMPCVKFFSTVRFLKSKWPTTREMAAFLSDLCHALS